MSLDPPAYILSLQNNIRARPISWEGAVRAKTITDAELKKIKSVDKVRKEQRRQTIEGDQDGFCKLFLGGSDVKSIFESAAKRQDITQYLLVLLGDIVDGVTPCMKWMYIQSVLTDTCSDISSFASTLLKHEEPYKPLLPLLKHSSNAEDPIPLLTSSVLSSLLSHALTTSSKPPAHLEEAMPSLFNYLTTLAKSSDSGLQDIAVQGYSAVLKTRDARQLFWKHRIETLSPLIDTLRSAAGAGNDSDSTVFSGGSSIRNGGSADSGLGGNVGIQLLYHVLLVVWQLSFEAKTVGKGLDEQVTTVAHDRLSADSWLSREHDIVPLYIQLLRISPKEKLTRLLISTLYNLLSSNQSTLVPAASLARLPALLGNLKGRHLTDTDLLEDVDKLNNMLDEYSKSQTTFDEYAAEVRSGHLRWSPPHRNAQFWKENARKIIEHEKGELPKKLAEILGKSWDTEKQVLAIGCNDVAFMVQEVPEKKQALEKLGLKTRVMELMQADNESVRYESLRAVGQWMRYSLDK